MFKSIILIIIFINYIESTIIQTEEYNTYKYKYIYLYYKGKCINLLSCLDNNNCNISNSILYLSDYQCKFIRNEQLIYIRSMSIINNLTTKIESKKLNLTILNTTSKNIIYKHIKKNNIKKLKDKTKIINFRYTNNNIFTNNITNNITNKNNNVFNKIFKSYTYISIFLFLFLLLIIIFSYLINFISCH